MPKRRVVTVILLTLAGVGIAGSALMGTLALQYYRERAQLRLSPANVDRFVVENRSLQAPKGRRVVFFGDSRIEQWQPRPDLPDAELIWRGIPAETTAQMLLRFDEDVLALTPTAIVIQGGINDVVLGSALRMGSAAADSAIDNLVKMATMATTRGCEVYLLTVVRPASPTLLRRPVWHEEIYDLVATMNARLHALDVKQITIVDVDRALAGDGSGILPQEMSADTLHLTAAAYATINAQLLHAMKAPAHAVQ